MDIDAIKFIFETLPQNDIIVIDYDADRPLTVNLNYHECCFKYGSVIFRGYNNNGIIVIDSEAINMIKSYKSKINSAMMEEQIEMEV